MVSSCNRISHDNKTTFFWLSHSSIRWIMQELGWISKHYIEKKKIMNYTFLFHSLFWAVPWVYKCIELCPEESCISPFVNNTSKTKNNPFTGFWHSDKCLSNVSMDACLLLLCEESVQLAFSHWNECRRVQLSVWFMCDFSLMSGVQIKANVIFLCITSVFGL